jgi:uncharacterized membrane protein YraQ (UPF0718 family)
MGAETAVQRPQGPGRSGAIGLGLFLALAVVGLYLVKWDPYFHKAFAAAAHHSIGSSIVSGSSATAPALGWKAAWDYMIQYGKAIWKALIVGLLLGAGVQALLPRDWLLRVLGGAGYRGVAVGGLASVPSMM